jgi:trans-2,3-dihydro-3-hydroxyanthranilate isomerase
MTAYRTVDVFTRQRFAGNPLAVVPDARGLDPADLQAIAREFAYSETTFVLPPADARCDARVRIFTPEAELPFAGHPNVGTAFVLATLARESGRPAPTRMRFEEGAGIVEVEIEGADGEVTGAAVRAPAPLSLGPARDPVEIAALAGLSPTRILGDTHPPRHASVGTGFLLAETDRAGLDAAAPDIAAFRAEAARLAAGGDPAHAPALFLWCRDQETADRLLLSCRMFAPTLGVLEDPATGSAAAALGALLHTLGVANRLEIAQGADIGRPSAIAVRSGPDGTWIAGDCVPVFEGRIL